MKTVFISSTSIDLKDYREAAIKTCLDLGFHPIAMENFPAMGMGATAGSKKKLDGADLYVGIYAHRYGYIEDEADGRGVTEIEFDYAGERGLDRLCFVVDPKHPWPRDAEDYKNHDKLEAFKKKIDRLIRAQFTDVNDFRARLSHALTDWNGANPERPAATSATLASHPDDVPDKPRKLIGRDDLKADVTRLLDGSERVLLQGFGGQGKTALAATIGAEWIQAGKGSVLWLRTGSANAEALFEALARPFGQHQAIARETGDNKIAVMRQMLRGCGAKLLVLDDCWNGGALNTVLRAVPSDLPVLVTARQRYPLEGPVREVEQLQPGDALALLGYHVGITLTPQPSLDPNPHPPAPSPLRREGESDAERLCGVLGYHAFALEIAGKNLKANQWTAGELLKRIEAAPEQLSLPLEFAQEGRESVAKLIEVSLTALDEEARAVFRAMGALFAPQMTAEMVGLYFEGATPTPTLPRVQGRESLDERLTTLVQHGLVTPVAASDNTIATYRLHDLAYSYARAQNGDEQRGQALDACLAYVARYNEPSLPNFAALRPELDNLLNAAGWAFGAGQVDKGENFVVGLYISTRGGGGFLYYQGFASQATRLLQQAADGHGRIGDKQKQGADLGNLGDAYRALGQVERAIGYHEQALQISREIGDRGGEGNHLGNLGTAYYSLGQVERAIGYHEQALQISREIGDRGGEGSSLGNLGIAYSALGQVERAIGYYEQALQISREIGDRRGEGSSLGNLGIAYYSLGQVERAIGYHEQALQISREIGDRGGEGSSLGNLGIAYSALGQVERAIEYHEQALSISREIGDRMGESNDLNNIGALREVQEDYVAALDYYQQARAIRVEIGAQHLVDKVDRNIARVRGKLGGG